MKFWTDYDVKPPDKVCFTMRFEMEMAYVFELAARSIRNHMKLRTNKILTGIALILFAIFIVFGVLGTTYKHWGHVNTSDLISIGGHISTQPKISGGNNRHNPIELNIKLIQIPNINFCNSGIFYDATSANTIVRTFQADDSINLLILKEDYHKKIIKDTKRSMFEKFADPDNRIDMYGILRNNLNYVQLEIINDGFGQKRPFVQPIAWILIIGLIAMGILKIFK